MTIAGGQKIRADEYLAVIAAVQGLIPPLIGTDAATVGTGARASLTVNVTGAWNFLDVQWYGRADKNAAAASAYLQLSGDTTSSYLWEVVETNNTTTTPTPSGATDTVMHIGTMPALTATANYAGAGRFSIAGASSSLFKVVTSQAAGHSGLTNVRIGTYAGQWNKTGAVTSITLMPDTGNWVVGSTLSVYGRM